MACTEDYAVQGSVGGNQKYRRRTVSKPRSHAHKDNSENKDDSSDAFFLQETNDSYGMVCLEQEYDGPTGLTYHLPS